MNSAAPIGLNGQDDTKGAEMRKLIADEFISLDGVAQAPGGADEDTSGGFAHGGWHMQYNGDELTQRWVLDSIGAAGGFLLGRRTYDIFAAYWPTASEEQQAYAEPLNQKPKYVVTTRTEPLEWENSTPVAGNNLSAAVASLKQADGGDLHTIGSAQLVRTLTEQDLVDEYRLMIDPVLLGGGKRIFPADGVRRPLRLVEGQVTSTGAILVTYAPAK